MNAQITRRRMVATEAPALTAETEIAGLFREWEQMQCGERPAYASEADDAEDFLTAVETKIAAIPPTNLRDYAMKVIVWTIYGTGVDGSHFDAANDRRNDEPRWGSASVEGQARGPSDRLKSPLAKGVKARQPQSFLGPWFRECGPPALCGLADQAPQGDLKSNGDETYRASR